MPAFNDASNIVCPSSILSMPSPKSSIVKCSFITAFKISIGLKSAPIHRKVKNILVISITFIILIMFQVNQSAGFLLGSLAKKTAARFLQLMQSEKIDIGLSAGLCLADYGKKMD
jgi:hypothetical protein